MRKYFNARVLLCELKLNNKKQSHRIMIFKDRSPSELQVSVTHFHYISGKILHALKTHYFVIFVSAVWITNCFPNVPYLEPGRYTIVTLYCKHGNSTHRIAARPDFKCVYQSFWTTVTETKDNLL